MTARTIAISGCDHVYFPLLRDLLLSIRRARPHRQLDIGIMDYGLLPEQTAELRNEWNAKLIKPQWRFSLPPNPSDRTGLIFSSRLYLPADFPGYDVYLWIDADAWLQSAETLDAFIDGAAASSCAIVVERHPFYRVRPRLKWRNLKHFVLGYGVRKGLWLESKPHVNMGIFALRHDAPHWRLWHDRLRQAYARTNRIAPHDQFAFNQVVHEDAPPTTILSPERNWICDKAAPVWDPGRKLLVTPDESHRPIGFVHLAGPAAKGKRHAIPILGGGQMQADLRFSAFARLLDGGVEFAAAAEAPAGADAELGFAAGSRGRQ